MSSVVLKDLVVVTGEGIGVDLVVMIIHIIGLQGVLRIVVAGIIPQDTLLMAEVEGIGGIGLGHRHMLHMVAQIGGMLVGLGDILH